MMEGLGLLCFDLSSAETDVWWLEDEDFAYFRVRMTFYVHRGSGQARVYPRRWLSLSSRVKTFTLQGRHRRFVGDSALHTSLRGAPPLVGEQQKWYQQILEKVQNLVPHDYIKSCTVYGMLLYSSMCVCVCVYFFPFILDTSSLDVPAGVTQEGGNTGFLIHLLSAMRSLIFLARRIQPFFSLVDREVGFLCTNDFIVLHTRVGHFFLVFSFFLVSKIPFAGIELTSQRVSGLHGYL